MISKQYKESIKEQVIKNFIDENKRSPTRSELKDLVAKAEARYPSIDTLGYSGYDLISRPNHKDVSSLTSENLNRSCLWNDAIVLASKIDYLVESWEEDNMLSINSIKRTSRTLTELESRLDNLILSNSSASLFTSTLEEVFDNSDKVIQSQSSATVESGYVTLGRAGYTLVNLDQVKLAASPGSVSQIIGIQADSPISSLKEDDGTTWDYIVYTKEQRGKVSLILNIELSEEAYVGELRLVNGAVSTNDQTLISCFYSIDGATWIASDSLEEALVKNYTCSLGVDKVKKIQLVLTKKGSDSFTANRNAYAYIFSLDSLKIYADVYEQGQRDIIVCGPYEVLDTFGNPVYFTQANISACVVEPESTSASFFLSKDNQNWISVDWRNNLNTFVLFGDSTATQSSSFIDEESAAGSLIDDDSGKTNYQTEALINTFISSDYVDMVPFNSIVIKRNIVSNSSPNKVLGTAPGWRYDKRLRRYTTTVYISNPEGKYINFGNTVVFVNDIKATGNVFFPPGYSTVSTASTNWIEIEAGLTDSTQIAIVDPLYPYNHKYLIEGYGYAASHTGEKVYLGVDSYFAKKLQYVTSEEFAYIQKQDFEFLDVFTVEDIDGNWYIKVKVDKTDSTWIQELFELDWIVQSGDSNLLYVKAVLNTNKKGKTPRIDSFKVRVI